MINSLLRLEEHRALETIELNGSVIDIGGDKKSKYIDCIKGTHTVTTVNLDEKSKPDIFHDLEKPLPLQDATFDHALVINVLEHIFNYRELLKESIRVIKPQGTLVIIVPFLFPVHPSPSDFHRFSEETLKRELELLNISYIKIQALGSGVFAARYLMLDRLMPGPIRFVSYYTCRYLVYGADWLFTKMSHSLGKKYRKEDYALGYCVTGIKSL